MHCSDDSADVLRTVNGVNGVSSVGTEKRVNIPERMSCAVCRSISGFMLLGA